MHDNELAEALHRAATEPAGKPMALGADLEKSTVIPVSPGIFNGITISTWADQ
jgi:hypothetical protein